MMKQQQSKSRRQSQQQQPVGIYNAIFQSNNANTKKRSNVVRHHNVDDTSAAINQQTNEAPIIQQSNQKTSLYKILNPKSHSAPARLFQTIISVIIILDSFIYILSTEPLLEQRFAHFFYIIEGITSTIFLMELLARLLVCTEKKCYSKYGPIKGRLIYLWSFQGFIDTFATLPFFVELIFGIDLPTLTYLRVFRLIRITRTRSYTKAIDAVGRVLYFNREILHVAALLGMYLVVVTSILLYYLRPRGVDVEGVDDITAFESIASTMVLSILMLTGQGGPSGKLPWYTQAIVLLTGIFSVAMFAIPASMLTWGFEAEAQRLGMKAKRRALAKRKGQVYMSDTSSSSSDSSSISCLGDISTSDEEYMNIIGGDNEEEKEEESLAQTQNRVHGSASSREDEAVQDILHSMQLRMEEMEKKVISTNAKLDLILTKLEGR
jgi:voltage-gated potassium channel